MKRLKQAFPHKPEQGQYGDCQRTVFACLLDLDSPHDVPHFGSDFPPNGVFWDRANAWLGQQGYKLVSFAYDGNVHRRDVLRCMGMQNPGVYYILAGTSFTGFDHVIICLGDSEYHDPSPRNVNVISPGSDGLWRVEVLVPLCMTTLKRPDGVDMLVPWNGGQTGTALPPEPTS